MRSVPLLFTATLLCLTAATTAVSSAAARSQRTSVSSRDPIAPFVHNVQPPTDADLKHLRSVFKAQGGAATTPNRTLCSIKEKATLHVRSALAFYASEFPGITWHHRWISNALWPSERAIARWWAVHGNTQCDGLIGPGWSAAAIAVSPLVDTLWLDPSSTSTQLSDKTRHEHFSRTIVSDSYAGPIVAETMHALGWRSCNLFFIDDTFGRSISEAFKQRWRELNNTLETVRSASENLPVIPNPDPTGNATTDTTAVTDAIDAFRASRSTVTFAVVRPWIGAGKAFTTSIRPYLNSSMMLFLEPTACDEENDIKSLHYALCLSYFRNVTLRAPYFQFYDGLNHTALSEELAEERGADPDGGKANQIATVADNKNYYAQFVIDTTFHMMSFMHSRKDAEVTNTTHSIALLRSFKTDGITGPIRLDANGDRTTADLNVMNILPDATRVTVGAIQNNNVVKFVNGSDTEFYLLGRASTVVPPSELPGTDAPSTLSPLSLSLILSASIIGFALLVIGLLVMIYLLVREPAKDSTHAPKPTASSECFTMCFTDIEASGMLWARAPEFMGEALDIHNTIIRALIIEHNGYEVKTIGDSFMVAFNDPCDAVQFAMGVQRRIFLNGNVGAHVEDTYKELDRERKRLVAHPVGASYDALWHGLRLRIGIHYAGGEAKYEATSRSWDYMGPVVNIAAQVESIGHGGQTLITSDVLDAVNDRQKLHHRPQADEIASVTSVLEGVTMTNKGDVNLSGHTTINVYQLLPTEFDRRDFPPLRTERAANAFDDDTEDKTFPTATPGGVPDSSDGSLNTSQNSNSKRSAYSYMNNWDDRQALAAYLVKHYHLKVSPKMLLYQHNAIVALLSTSKMSQRSRIVESIVRSWRVPTQLKLSPAHRRLRDVIESMPRDQLQLLLVAARVTGSVGINLRETPLLPSDGNQTIALSTEIEVEDKSSVDAPGATREGSASRKQSFRLPILPTPVYGSQLTVPGAVPAVQFPTSSGGGSTMGGSMGGSALPISTGSGVFGQQPAQHQVASEHSLHLPRVQSQGLLVQHAPSAPNVSAEAILAGARERTASLSGALGGPSATVGSVSHSAGFTSPVVQLELPPVDSISLPLPRAPQHPAALSANATSSLSIFSQQHHRGSLDHFPSPQPNAEANAILANARQRTASLSESLNASGSLHHLPTPHRGSPAGDQSPSVCPDQFQLFPAQVPAGALQPLPAIPAPVVANAGLARTNSAAEAILARARERTAALDNAFASPTGLPNLLPAAGLTHAVALQPTMQPPVAPVNLPTPFPQQAVRPVTSPAATTVVPAANMMMGQPAAMVSQNQPSPALGFSLPGTHPAPLPTAPALTTSPLTTLPPLPSLPAGPSATLPLSMPSAMSAAGGITSPTATVAPSAGGLPFSLPAATAASPPAVPTVPVGGDSDDERPAVPAIAPMTSITSLPLASPTSPLAFSSPGQPLMDGAHSGPHDTDHQKNDLKATVRAAVANDDGFGSHPATEPSDETCQLAP